jgi:putative colanic acid biosynthesis acetyltransferase WcaF
LKAFGAKIGPGVKIDPTVSIWAPWNLHMGEQATLGHHVDCYCVAPITIGQHATVSQYAFLCSATHDVTSPTMQLISSPIIIEEQAWVCANAFIGPGITLHQGAVAGACAVVTKDIPAWKIAVGNPARIIKDRVLK